MKLQISFLFVFAFIARICSSSQDVPVLVWSQERPLTELKDADTFEPVKSADFHEKVLVPIKAENGVVFVQDKLHADDFTKYADVYSTESDGGAFKNIKNAVDEHFSLEIPQVMAPHVAIEQFSKSFDGDVFVVTSLTEVEGLNLGNGKQFLLIYNLSPIIEVPDEEKAIKENDAVVGKVVDHLKKKNIKYTAVFTGKSAGKAVVEAAEVHSNRHLLEASTGDKYNGTFLNASNGDVYIFMYNMSVCYQYVKDNGCGLYFNLFPNSNAADKTTQNKDNASIVLTFNNVKPENSSTIVTSSDFNIELNMLLVNQKTNWLISNTHLSVTPTTPQANFSGFTDALLMTNQAYTSIPIPYSYHCSDYVMTVNYVKDISNKNLTKTYIKLNEFQIQAFNVSNNQFFNAEDCVPFFTKAIWMGLVPTALLIFIMIVGVIMTLQLSTMDRYDDPKGKTITVTVSE